MELSEIREAKAALEKKVSDAMLEFEKETSCQISELGFVRRDVYTEDEEIARPVGVKYVVEMNIKI